MGHAEAVRTRHCVFRALRDGYNRTVRKGDRRA